MNTNIIGLSGVAGSGKDLFCKVLLEKAPKYKSLSLASRLKSDLRDKIIDEYNIDIFNCSREEKNSVRQELVDYGGKKRAETMGRFWIEKLNPEITKLNEPVCITDIRYDDYEFDEVFWLKKELKGVLVHIERSVILNNNKKIIEAANEEERRNDPKLKDGASYNVRWPTFEEDVEKHAGAYVNSFLAWLNVYDETVGGQSASLEDQD
jgi:hypothetical protein